MKAYSPNWAGRACHKQSAAWGGRLAVVVVAVFLATVHTGVSAEFRILDFFLDADKRPWSEFHFGEAEIKAGNGILTVELQGPPGQPLVGGVAYEAERFELPAEASIEFQVDLLEAEDERSLAVLGWFPIEDDPLSRPLLFRGYYLAVGNGKVAVGKGLHDYLGEEELPAEIGERPLRLVLALSADQGTVAVEAAIQDPAENGEVLWAGRFTGGDFESDHLLRANQGRFVLMHFIDAFDNELESSRIVFANPGVSVPSPDEVLPPFILPLSPKPGEAFVERSGNLFAVDFLIRAFEQARLQGYAEEGTVAHASGPEEEGRAWRVTNIMRLDRNQEHLLLLKAWNQDIGLETSTSSLLRFDTFTRDTVVIEAEDYDFDGGRFQDNPVSTSEWFGWEPMAYAGKAGLPGEDYHSGEEPRGASDYRPADRVSIQRALDHVRPWYEELGGPAGGVYDYMVHEIEAGDFRNYTRTFPEGVYEIYLRQAVLGLERAEAVLESVERVDGIERITQLGSFVGSETGFQFANVPMESRGGGKIWVPLHGETTLRLRQISARPERGDVYQNYLVLVPRLAAAVVLVSASDVAGPWLPEETATYDLEQGRITTALPDGSARFFRVWSSESWSIKDVRLAGNQVLFECEKP